MNFMYRMNQMKFVLFVLRAILVDIQVAYYDSASDALVCLNSKSPIELGVARAASAHQCQLYFTEFQGCRSPCISSGFGLLA